MKTIFLILVLAFAFEWTFALQPLRKPRVLIVIDGKEYTSGDLFQVKPGQKFVVQTQLEGGRRDYCNFPDVYADIVGKAEILSRGKDGMSYQLDGKKYEWKLVGEHTTFSSEDYLQIKPLADEKSAEITVGKGDFSQTFITLNAVASWQFTHDGSVSEETNQAEGTIYIQLAGASDVWFKTRNVEASGIKNPAVQEKLFSVQALCDSIEQKFYRLDFPAVQQNLRMLQEKVNQLKATIDEAKAQNPSYRSKILFIGLPSDEPYKSLGVISAVKESWTSSEAFLNGLKQRLSQLPDKKTGEAQEKLIKIIGEYIDWQNRLPTNTFRVLPRFMPELNIDSIRVPANLHFSAKENSVADYDQALKEFSVFIDQRIQRVPGEVEKINSVYGRLQAISLFDPMLRSYFSSIVWAQWQSTRGF